MSIIVSCSACNVRLTLGDDRAGDRFECPQCDATIKVPMPAQPPPRAPAATPPSPEPARTALPAEPEPEPGRDKRVVAGIFAGIAALLLVGVAVTVFAFSKPTETAKRDAEPAPAAPPTGVVAPAAAPANIPSEAKPSATGTADPQPKADPPSKPDPVPVTVLPPQFSAQFLGSQGQGRRFCIIADYSDSMRGAKLANAKTQLVKTLTELNPEAEYYVIAFHARPEPMPYPTWLKAGAAETEKVKEWAKSLGTHNGTIPFPAFEAAFKLSPPPDVIFFMTDGQFAAAVPGKVAELNGTPPKTVVNTILFASTGKGAAKAGNAEDLLKQIATKSGGTFTRYVP